MVIENDYITENEQQLIDKLIAVWSKKLSRNNIRQRYYDAKQTVKNLDIAIPNSLAWASKSTLGWGAKAVDALAVRSRFDGFVYKGLDEDPLADVIRDNNFFDLYRQATTSELINSCVFVTIGAGTDGEPDVVLNMYPATQAAAIWNTRAKRIDCGIVITEFEDNVYDKPQSMLTDTPKAFVLYTDNATFSCERKSGKWEVDKKEHEYDRPLMEALVYNPSLRNPFGKSRISRAAMSIIDRALRTTVRMDIAAEFFTAPQKYLLGVEKEVFENKTKYETYMDSIIAISKDEDGDIPQFGQLSQGQLSPLTEQLRSLAAEFSGETSIPISSLGIIHDNPASAEGIYATKEDLIMVAENLNTTNGNALRNIGLLALMILGGYKSVGEMPTEWQSITPKFKNPARPSVVSQSDAIIKQVSAIPQIAETDVALEQLGYSESDITRMKAQWTKSAGASSFMEIAEQLSNEENTNS